MAAEKWNEAGKIWEEDHGLLDDEQVAQCARADVAEPFRSPIPTRMISNGEYMPVAQTGKQQQVEARIQELAASASKKLGIDRRRFLAGTGGMAASLLAMNEVFGHFFDVDYKIPSDLIKDKRKVTVRFQATAGSEIPTVFGVRTIRAEANR